MKAKEYNIHIIRSKENYSTMFSPDFAEEYEELPLHDAVVSVADLPSSSLKKIDFTEAQLRAKAEARLGKSVTQGMTLGEIIGFLDGE